MPLKIYLAALAVAFVSYTAVAATTSSQSSTPPPASPAPTDWYLLNFKSATCQRPDGITSFTPRHLVDTLRAQGIIPSIKILHPDGGGKVVEISNMLHGSPVTMLYFTSVDTCNAVVKHLEAEGKLVPLNQLN